MKSGVRQGCIISPILFNITLDYIMRQTTHNAQHGIQWTMFSQLEDLDYADDIALLSINANTCSRKQMFSMKTQRKKEIKKESKETIVNYIKSEHTWKIFFLKLSYVTLQIFEMHVSDCAHILLFSLGGLK